MAARKSAIRRIQKAQAVGKCDSRRFRFYIFSFRLPDTICEPHFPILTLSNFDNFQFWHFSILTFSSLSFLIVNGLINKTSFAFEKQYIPRVMCLDTFTFTTPNLSNSNDSNRQYMCVYNTHTYIHILYTHTCYMVYTDILCFNFNELNIPFGYSHY